MRRELMSGEMRLVWEMEDFLKEAQVLSNYLALKCGSVKIIDFEGVACEMMGISLEDLFSDSRKEEVITARSLCVHYLKNNTRATNQAIAKRYNRDDSNISYILRVKLKERRIIDRIGDFEEKLFKSGDYSLVKNPFKDRWGNEPDLSAEEFEVAACATMGVSTGRLKRIPKQKKTKNEMIALLLCIFFLLKNRGIKPKQIAERYNYSTAGAVRRVMPEMKKEYFKKHLSEFKRRIEWDQ